MKRGDRLRLTIERPAAGGRMIARHDGAIVFVSGAIPGEVVEADVEKVQRGTVWAVTREVVEASADRVPGGDGECGGSVFAHIAYERQRALKSAIIEDAFRRIGRITLDAPVEVTASRIDGYRMRARLHVRSGRIGFFREGTHTLCDAGPTRQLLERTTGVIARLEQSLGAAADIVNDIEVSENREASERAVHFELRPDADPARLAALATLDGITGASCAHAESVKTLELSGSPYVTDTIHGVTLARHVRSFFQGNRFLLEPFVEHVIGFVDAGSILDLYAGVGLFSLTAATRGVVTAVEGDQFSSADLKRNATGHNVSVKHAAVEEFVARARDHYQTVIVDPPRTGMSKEAVAGVVALKSPRLIYVSCDIATLARDARVLLDAGYRMEHARAFDMFPNTAHVETVISFSK